MANNLQYVFTRWDLIETYKKPIKIMFTKFLI